MSLAILRCKIITMQLKTADDILTTSEGLLLYEKLVLQLNKDFSRANIFEQFSEDILPIDLKVKLHNIIFTLIQKQNSDYLNLLYIIDVSEGKIKQIKGDTLNEIVSEISYLILLREWQKVWFKSNY